MELSQDLGLVIFVASWSWYGFDILGTRDAYDINT